MIDKKILSLLLVGMLFIYLGFLKENSPKSTSSPSAHSSDVASLPKSEQNAKDVLGTSTGTTPTSIGNTAQQGARVVEVVDGDTVVTNSGEKIRYIGINTPEKDQPYFYDAKEGNEQLVLGKTVEIQTDVQPKDVYGRTLGYVFIGGVFVNKEMVKRGLAVTETIAPNIQYQDEILKAQKEARANCIGIWSGLCSQAISGQPLSKCIQIVSINADAAGNDKTNKNDEWIAFANTCSSSVVLDSWLLKDNSASNWYNFKNYTLAPGRKVTLHSGCGTDSQNDLYWQCPEAGSSIWNNDHDHAFLYNSQGRMVADYEY